MMIRSDIDGFDGVAAMASVPATSAAPSASLLGGLLLLISP
jgi:hypothetical protein